MNPPSRLSALLTAALVLLALLATACGSATASTEQSLALDNTNSGAVANSGAESSAPIPPAGESPATDTTETAAQRPTSAPETGGHQYGSTLAEWAGDDGQQGTALGESGYAEIAWEDLIPPGSSGEELMAQFEDELDAVTPGSDEAVALWTEIQEAYNPEAVNTDLNGENIVLAGFVAPLTYDGEIITEFLLVPTFGACIHVPPPPPNQTIMVSLDKENGLSIDDSWGAVWVEGTLVIESGDSDLGATSYTITQAASGPYTSF